MIKFINKENYKFIIIFLGILILGILYYGNYNLIEGTKNLCNINEACDTGSDLGTSDNNNGTRASQRCSDMSQRTAQIAGLNDQCQ